MGYDPSLLHKLGKGRSEDINDLRERNGYHGIIKCDVLILELIFNADLNGAIIGWCWPAVDYTSGSATGGTHESRNLLDRGTLLSSVPAYLHLKTAKL